MMRYPRSGCAVLVAAMHWFASAGALAQTSEPAPGVALDLATARARDISQLRYELSLSIPLEHTQPATGTNVLRFRLADANKPLVVKK